MNTSATADIRRALTEGRARVSAAAGVWIAGDFARIAEAPELLLSAVELVRQAGELLQSAAPNVRRQIQPDAAALAREVSQLSRLVDSSAAFYRGIAARIQGEGSAYDTRGLIAAVPESSEPSPIEA